MRAAIIIDDWKSPIFERHLLQAGYSYEKRPGLTESTLLLTVETDDAKALGTVVRAANTEAVAASNVRTGTIH
jgi:hypothetical protein